MIRVADYVFKRLEENEITSIFYVPGGQCVFLMDALRRNQNISGIAMHHEQAVAMAALTYSEFSGKIGAGLVTTGCAGTNTMTGLLHAWQDSIPMIIISGQQNFSQTVKSSGFKLRQVGIQEADIETIVAPITKFAVTVEDEKKIAYYIDKAFYCAMTGRKGPVWIDLPLNIQNAMVEEEKLERFICDYKNYTVCEEDINYVVSALKNSERPVILAGNGVKSAKANIELSMFAHSANIPVLFTRHSYDIFHYENKYNFGVVASPGGAARYANFIVQNSDCVLCIGNRLSIDTTGPEREKFARAAKIIVVDIDKTEHSKKGVKIDKLILSDANDFLKKIIESDSEYGDYSKWVEKCRHWKDIMKYEPVLTTEENKIDAKYFMQKVSQYSAQGTTYISDAGFTGAAAPSATFLKEGERFIHSHAQGEMGYSLPGACGAAVLTDKPVVAYAGDGSFMMNMQELQTIVRNNFNIKIVIINNNGYSGVRHGQKAHFRGKTIGTDPSNGVDFPSFEKIADAFGIKYTKVKKDSEIDEGIKTMFADNAPFICEVMCDPDQFDLHNALVTYGKRQFGFRPIEDQSPFLDRETFFAEMIIEPMETSYGDPV